MAFMCGMLNLYLRHSEEQRLAILTKFLLGARPCFSTYWILG